MQEPKKAKNIILSTFFQFMKIGCAYLLQIIIAKRFGMSATLDSYFAAYGIVYFVYRIIGVVVSPLLIPQLSKGIAEKNKDIYKLISSIINTLLLFVVIFPRWDLLYSQST